MIILKLPQNREEIELLTEIQIKFLESDRSGVNSESFDYLNLQKSQGDDYSFPRKIRFEWEAFGEAVLHISEDEGFNEYYSKTGENFCDVENLKCGTRYFWRVVCNDEASDVFCFDTTNRYPRIIRIDGITNVRDCGGWKTNSGKFVKQGLMYRGSELNSHVSVTAEGIKTMEEVLKIKSVLDLRGETEIVEDVYKHGYINLPVKSYIDWFKHPDITRQIFEFLSDEENYPVYYHCWGGADRTGTLAFLLGALLGMSHDELIDDYEITSLSIWGTRTRNSEDTFKRFLTEFNALDGKTYEEKAQNYFLSCGVDEKSIIKFRKLMLN